MFRQSALAVALMHSLSQAYTMPHFWMHSAEPLPLPDRSRGTGIRKAKRAAKKRRNCRARSKRK